MLLSASMRRATSAPVRSFAKCVSEYCLNLLFSLELTNQPMSIKTKPITIAILFCLLCSFNFFYNPSGGVTRHKVNGFYLTAILFNNICANDIFCQIVTAFYQNIWNQF